MLKAAHKRVCQLNFTSEVRPVTSGVAPLPQEYFSEKCFIYKCIYLSTPVSFPLCVWSVWRQACVGPLPHMRGVN